MLTFHRLPDWTLDQLARGQSEKPVLAMLRDGQHSARRLLLRAVVDEAIGHPDTEGPLDGIDAPWGLLVAAEAKDPGAVSEVLLLPQIGVWLADTLRALRGSRTSPTPLWVEVGHLRCVAAVAAVRAGLAFRIDVPLRDGVVSLPSLGSASLPARRRWDVATLTGTTTSLTVSTTEAEVVVPDGPGWLETRRLRVSSAGIAFAPLLDDADPYRDYREQTPASRVAIEPWQALLDNAWDCLVTHHPHTATALAATVTALVPTAPLPDGRPYSGSSADACGAILLSEPPTPTALGEALAHEAQHTKLSALTTMLTLYSDDDRTTCYAPWRDDPRPVGGLFQGVYAFLGVTAFWRTQRHVAKGAEADLAEFEFALWREGTLSAARQLHAHAELTPVGRRFAEVMVAQLEEWSEDEVPAPLLDQARHAALDHRAAWRAWHLVPDRAGVAELARAWLAGANRPARLLPDPELVPHPTQRLDRRLLRRLRLSAPREFAESGKRVADATPADLAYISGDPSSAAKLYEDEVRRRPDRVSGWIGLGLTDPSAAAVLQEPELVLALHAEIRRASGEFPDPRALAAWIGG